MSKQPSVSKDSPFLPTVSLDSFITLATDLIQHEGYDPAPAIATAISEVMDLHLKLNLYPFLLSLTEYGTTEQDLKMLNLGFRYPLDTILASAVCKHAPKEKRAEIFNTLLVPSTDPLRRFIQNAMLTDLNATINLLNMDPSAAFVFEFLKKYPYSQDKYFLLGMEVASIFFFGLSQAVSTALPDNHWLTQWQGIDQT